MKTIYFLLAVLATTMATNAQDITFFDDNFKAALLEASPSKLIAFDRLDNAITIDTNQDGEIQRTETENVYRLRLTARSLTDLSGIEFFSKLTHLECKNNNLTSLFLTDLPELYALDCSFNQLVHLEVAGLQNLQDLNFSFNQMQSAVDFSGMPNLHILRCNSNALTQLDLSPLSGLFMLDCSSNSITSIDISNIHRAVAVMAAANNFETILMENGFEDNVDFSQNPTITAICADAIEHVGLRSKIISYGYDETRVSVTACALNIENNDSTTTAVLYPNPANQFLNIQLEKGNLLESVQIYNTLGQLVFTGKINQSRVDVTHLKTGNYIVKTTTAKGISTTKFTKI